MRVHVKPTGLHSRAMVRVSNALTRYAPTGIEIVDDPSPSECDLVVLHVIGRDAITVAEQMNQCEQRWAVIQYCLKTAGFSRETCKDWFELWRGAECLWSYYDLSDAASVDGWDFYYAPLGLDDAFLSRSHISSPSSRPFILTSGYVSGPGAEPIAEVWEAARRLGINAVHIGPKVVEGMTTYPPDWDARHQISDGELAELYARATWVAALRHVEGFELPAAEGLACGARPIVFSQPALWHWYGDHAIYVLDQSGEPLIQELCKVMRYVPEPVSAKEHEQVVRKFNWERVCTGFWARVQASIGEVAA